MTKQFINPILLAVLFIILYFSHSLFRHLTFNSHAFDLGIYTQSIYLYSQGELAFSTLKHMPILADHFGLVLFLLSPIYKIFPSAATLLAIQALFVALSSIPIFLIAQDKLKNPILSTLIVLSYLTSVGIVSAITFDFHLATISVFPLSLMLYFWCFKKWNFYWITLFSSIAFKEDVPLFILGLGLFQLIQKQIRTGILTILFALGSFYLIKFIVMPFFWAYADQGYISTSILPLDSPLDLIAIFIFRPTIFLDQMNNSPVKIATFDLLYKQFAYLPILSPLSWLTVVPDLFIRFSTTYYASWTTIYHHNAELAPFLAVSSILAISYFKITKLPISLLLIFFLITSSLSPRSFVWGILQKDFNEIKKFDYIYNSTSTLPKSATISAQSPLIPHLANRERIYLFPEIYDAEYIILDKSLSSYPMNKSDLDYKISLLKKSPQWEIDKQVKTLIIFRKKKLM